MNDWIIHFFIKNSHKVDSPHIRTAYGLCCGWVGIITNILLCFLKMSIGIFTGSIAVIADAVNNFSDAGSAMILLIGFKLANKPADDKHPFGHGRLEYIAGLIVSILVIAVGLNFLKISIDRLINPSQIIISNIILIILLVSLPVKLWMFFFYRNVSQRISSKAIYAMSFDSLSDLLTSSLVILSLLFSQYTSFPIDGCVGILMALFIIWGGYKVVKEIIDPLLGECPDHELVKKIREQLLLSKDICGVHDIIVHSYGPNRYFATAHAEINPEKMDLVRLHDILESAEVNVSLHLPVRLVLHCDPFSADDQELKQWRILTEEIVCEIDPVIKVYDFRIDQSTSSQIKVKFQLLVPRNFMLSNKSLKHKVSRLLRQHDRRLSTHIEITHSFV